MKKYVSLENLQEFTTKLTAKYKTMFGGGNDLFSFQVALYGATQAFIAEKGMTWAQFIDSKYNPNAADVYPNSGISGKLFVLTNGSVGYWLNTTFDWIITGVMISEWLLEDEEWIENYADVVASDAIRPTKYVSAD